MNNQKIDATNGKLVSTSEAHGIGVAAFAVAFGLSWLFDLDIKAQSALFLVAGLVYAQLYRESVKEKFDR